MFGTIILYAQISIRKKYYEIFFFFCLNLKKSEVTYFSILSIIHFFLFISEKLTLLSN